MYAVDLQKARKADRYSDGKWVRSSGSIAPELVRLTYLLQVYAVAVGSIGAITAIVYSLASMVLTYHTVAILFAWDFVLVVLWAAVSGIFGTMYMHEKVEMDSGIKRMKTAVGFDLAGLVLWFITFCMGLWWFISHRKEAKHSSRSPKA
jgi:H+/Cl- antiporter ClcA